MSTTYPPLPSVFNVPWHLIGPWSHAQTHIWLILLYLDGLDSYIHAPELTTGDGRPCPALAWWGEPEPPVPPCTCRYGLFYVAGVVPTHALDPYANGWRRGVYAFRISPYCGHHGDARRSGQYLIEGGGLYEYVLDEDERRDH